MMKDFAISVALHAAVIGGAVALESVRESPPAERLPLEICELRFETREPPVPPEPPKPPPSPVPLENLDTLETLENLEPIVRLEPIEHLEPIERLENLEYLEKPETQEAIEAVKAAEEETSEPVTVVAAPEALVRIEPEYPRSARRRGHEGRVAVEISLSAAGEIESVEIVESSGYRELDASALAAVRAARFAPAMENGVAVAGRLRLAFDFRLTEARP